MEGGSKSQLGQGCIQATRVFLAHNRFAHEISECVGRMTGLRYYCNCNQHVISSHKKGMHYQ